MLFLLEYRASVFKFHVGKVFQQHPMDEDVATVYFLEKLKIEEQEPDRIVYDPKLEDIKQWIN
ncbi:MAG: hypothetical protein F6K58_19155 [Symploca sp. SIO2E9]|nr:hypothetical protein [Symploca sp. SIO2E9]